jgi:hypothetical protein
MVLDGALADAQIRGDILIWVAGKDQVHDLTPSATESCDVLSRGRPPGKQLARIPRLFESTLDTGEQVVAADRLRDEVG